MKPLKVNPEYRALVPRPTPEEYRALELDIIEKQRATEPIIINERDEILDGHTRFEICTKHNLYFDTKIMQFSSIRKEMIYIIEVNRLRRNLTPLQKLELDLKLAELYGEEASENKVIAGKIARDKQLGLVPIGTNPESIDTGAIIAKKGGYSRRTYFRGKKILEEGTEEEKQKARSGQETISRVFNKIQRRQKLEAAKASGSPPLPEGKYDIILADPPWRYGYEGSDRGKADIHYATIPTQEICDHPIKESIANNALLFLWVTNPLMEDGLKVLKAWGFNYITNFAWVKDKIGTGFWNRSKHELLFICKKGEFLPPADSDRLPSVIEAPRTEHSEKPEIVYEMIEKMYPHRHYLELFSRKKREGWVSWGLEAN